MWPLHESSLSCTRSCGDLLLGSSIESIHNAQLQGCCLTVLAKFRWSNLSLDGVLLGMQSPLQKSASSTLKVKRERKYERDREKLKQLLKKRKSVIG
jgi:hypothetical protein